MAKSLGMTVNEYKQLEKCEGSIYLDSGTQAKFYPEFDSSKT